MQRYDAIQADVGEGEVGVMDNWKTKTRAEHMQDFKDAAKEIDALSPILKAVIRFLCRQPQYEINTYRTKLWLCRQNFFAIPSSPQSARLEYAHARMVTSMIVNGSPSHWDT